MGDLPEPLTPPDCDMRGLEFMPLDVTRVLDSDLFAISTGDEFKAAFALWAKSWYQIPAASLPNDDRVLAHLSGAGRDWEAVKEVALRGWVLCSDGRWYHPVVAEKANEAMPRREARKNTVKGDAERKERERNDRKRMIGELRDAGIVVDWNIKTKELREKWSHKFCDTSQAGDIQNDVNRGVSTPVTPPVTKHEKPVTPPVMAKTGTGTGTGTKNNNYQQSSETARARSKPDDRLQAITIAAGFASPPSDYPSQLEEWLTAGADFDLDVLPTMRRVAKDLRDRGKSAPFKLKLFDPDIRQLISDQHKIMEKLDESIERTKDYPPHPDELIAAGKLPAPGATH